MEKTKTLAKRILSVALATMIVLSFALISVSAIPADYPIDGGKTITVDFENQNTAGFTNGNAFAVSLSDGSSEPTHSGNYSLKLTASGQYGKLKIEPKNILGSDWGFEANAQYYVSFWCYSPVSNGVLTGTNVGCPPYGGTVTYANSANVVNQWNKLWFKIDTTGTGTQTFFQPCFNYTAAGSVLYIDDVEIAKVTSITDKRNTIPTGTTAVKSALAYGENVALTVDQSVNNTDSGDIFEKTFEYAHWSEQGYKIVANPSTSITGIYVSLNNSKFFGSGATLKANTPYYISYYLYCPTKTVGTQFNYFSVGGSIINQTIHQGQWTKVSALFVPDEATATAANSHLLKLLITGTTGLDGVNHPVYLDDLVIAELSEVPAATALTAGEAEYGVAAETAKITINSTFELKSAGTVTVEGATVDSAVLSADEKSIELSLSGLTAETDYTAKIQNAKDVFDRAIADAEVTFKTPTAEVCPMEFASTSIHDGYKAVYAPVDAIYFTTPYELDPATVVAENFAIEGYKAAITGVELLSAKEVKVSVTGIYPKESYKLSVDNVKNTSGGILKDTLSFETTTAGGQYYLDFANGTIPSQISTNANLSNGFELVENFGHNDTKSVMLKGYNDGSYDYGRMVIGGMLNSKTYLISFWYYSDTWNGDTSYCQWLTPGEWTFTSKKTGQWNRAIVPVSTTASVAGMVMSFWGLGEGETVYIDDIKVVEIYEGIGSPVIKSGDSYKGNSVGEGTTVITIPVSSDATAIKGFAAQYDENGKMLRVAIGTSTENAINITIENGEEVRTKVFLWDAETSAPISIGYKYNYNVN